MKNKKLEKWITRIAIFKINLFILIVFSFGMIYTAENYIQGESIKTILFGVTLLLIIMLHLFQPMREVFDIIGEVVVERKEISQNHTNTKKEVNKQ